MSDSAIQTIITIGALVLGGFIAIKTSLSANKRLIKENEQLAADLRWNLHSGSAYDLIHLPFQSLPADRSCYFFQKNLGTSGYYFDGAYKNTQFALFPYTVPVGKYGQLNYLVTELKTAPQKNYDFVILSKAENNFLAYSGILHGYKNVKLEGDEFSQKFVVYTRQSDEAFYDLPPDKMAKLIDIDELSMMNRIYVQVKQTTTLIGGDYSPYDDWVNGRNKIPKEQILTGFMDVAIMIADTLELPAYKISPTDLILGEPSQEG